MRGICAQISMWGCKLIHKIIVKHQVADRMDVKAYEGHSFQMTSVTRENRLILW